MSDSEKSVSREDQVSSGDTMLLGREDINSNVKRSPRPTRVRLNERDVDTQLDLEKEDELKGASSSDRSVQSTQDTSRKIISFAENDSEHPNNWSQKKKVYVVFVSIATVINSTMSSSLAAGATRPLSTYFHVTDQEQLVLPTSIFLAGYTFGPLLFGPLSESFGRKWTMIYAFFLFTVFSMGSALAPNWSALIVFRLFVGISGACPIAVVGGVCADVYHNPESRGRAMALFMAATTFGPVLGPLISGFISAVTWRWSFWIGVIVAGIAWPFLILMPETYAPIILKRRAQKLRKETGDASIAAPIELEKTDIGHIITVVLTRPIRMFCFEPLVLCSCIYTSYAYGIFYIFFQSYPIIYTGIYDFNAGEEGLAFLPIGIGAVIASGIYLYWDSILRRAYARNTPWSRSEEMRRLPLACLAGPFFVLSLFWAGWTARKSIPWIVPTLAGIPFGIGYLCLFMALLNYLVDAYEIFAASAMAAASTSRSTFGTVLPFAARPMYEKLGVPWACSLLGFLSLIMCAIPFVFIRYGTQLRAKSKFCQYLAQKKKEEAAKREREPDGRMPEDVEAGGRRTRRPEADNDESGVEKN